MVRLVSIFSLVAAATAQSCTSFASLVQGNTNSPPAGLGIPDCAYVTANSAAICNTMAAWDIANSDTCYLKGPGYGCTINPGQFSTTVAVYCQLGPAAPVGTATASGSASASASPSASASVSSSASASVSPSVTSSRTALVSPSANPTASALATLTATPTPTPSQTPTGSITPTPSFTSLPSANVTIIYENAPMSNGVIAAIAFSSIFGLLVCCGAVGLSLRRSPAAAQAERLAFSVIERKASIVALAERTASVVAVVERRNSKAAEPRRNSIVEPSQRRKSTLELRAVEVQIEKKDLT